MVRVMIADDHTLVRQSLIKTVTAEEGFEVVAEAENGEEVVSRISTLKPDILVLDVAMPKLDGFQVAKQVQTVAPDTKILFMTMHDDDVHLRRAVTLNVAGFVSKSATTDEFLQALKTVADGESYLSPNALRRVMHLASGQSGDGMTDLSEREYDVLRYLAEGDRPQEIADKLFLSVKTVKNHLSNIYMKLGVETAAQAVATAYRQGLVRVEPTEQ